MKVASKSDLHKVPLSWKPARSSDMMREVTWPHLEPVEAPSSPNPPQPPSSSTMMGSITGWAAQATGSERQHVTLRCSGCFGKMGFQTGAARGGATGGVVGAWWLMQKKSVSQSEWITAVWARAKTSSAAAAGSSRLTQPQHKAEWTRRRQRSGWKWGAIRLARDSTDGEITVIPVIISVSIEVVWLSFYSTFGPHLFGINKVHNKNNSNNSNNNKDLSFFLTWYEVFFFSLFFILSFGLSFWNVCKFLIFLLGGGHGIFFNVKKGTWLKKGWKTLPLSTDKIVRFIVHGEYE